MKKLMNMTEPELKSLMTSCAYAIEGAAKIHRVEKPLFALIMFNDPAVGQYICNCERETTIKALRETADRLEAKQDIPR